MRRICRWSRWLAVACFALALGAQSIFTVVGGGSDDGRPATVAALDSPVSTAIDAEGNLYVADRVLHRVRKVDAVTGLISTIAGTGAEGFDGDGEQATLSQLDTPMAIAVDPLGNVLIADMRNDRIRKVDRRSGRISTIAGDGSHGFAGDGGPATHAALRNPNGLAVSSTGDVYFVDGSNERVRRINAATGIISTVAGNGTWGYSGDGGPATVASLRTSSTSGNAIDTTFARGLSVDLDHRFLYVSDMFNHRIRRVDLTSGVITTIAGTGSRGFSGDGGAATGATLDTPASLALLSGDLYVADGFNDRVRRVSLASGVVDTVAGGGNPGNVGDGGPATAAELFGCSGVTVSEPALVIASIYDHRVRSVDMPSRTIHTIVGTGFSHLFDENGPARAAGLIRATGVAFDAAGNMYIADMGSHRVRQVFVETGTIRTIAGVGRPGRSLGEGTVATETLLGDPMSVAVDDQGDVYVALAGDSRVRRISIPSNTIHTYAGTTEKGFSGDGGPATAARLNLESDKPDTVSATQGPGLVFDADWNLYIADRFNYRIRRVDRATGIITTVAGNGAFGFSGDGGAATLASMGTPTGMALDGAGNLIFADPDNERIRRIDRATGSIRTIAGRGPGPPSSSGPATQAYLAGPQGVTVDAQGNIYFTEIFGQRLLRIDAQTGQLTRVAGLLYEAGLTGDRGPVSSAQLSDPECVIAHRGVDLYIAEKGSSRVRAILGCTDVGTPVLHSPADGSSGVGQTVRLEWQPSAGVFSYDLYLDRTNPPARVVAPNVESTSFSPSGLTPGSTYFWRVIAKGDAFCSPPRSTTSSVWSFTTANTCQAPTIDGSGN